MKIHKESQILQQSGPEAAFNNIDFVRGTWMALTSHDEFEYV